MRLIVFIGSLFWMTALGLSAQHLPSIATGNYAGTHALYHNPALVADSRYSVYVNVVGTQNYIANNHVKWDVDYSFLKLITNRIPQEYRTDKGGIILPRRDLVERLNGNLKHLSVGGEVRLPSLMFSLKEGRIGVGLTTRARYLLQFDETTESLASLLRGTTKNRELHNIDFVEQSAKAQFNGLGEVALTVGGVLMDNETDFLKIGGTVKRVLGLSHIRVDLRRGDYEVRPDRNFNNQRELIEVSAIDASYNFTTDGAFQNFAFTPAWLLGSAPAGSGWGVDLGAVYEYRPDGHTYGYTERGVRKYDATKNKYLYRVAVSVTDIGRVRYRNPAYIVQQDVNTINRRFTYDTFEKRRGPEGFFNAVNQSLDTQPIEPITPFSVVLPMALQASLDYKLIPNLYVNTLWVQNLRNLNGPGMRGESVLAITPRYEHRWYELALPVSLMNRYGSVGIGLSARVGPLWFGTDHLAGMLNIGKPKVFNFYAGFSAGLFRRPPAAPNPCYPRVRHAWLKQLFSSRKH